MDSLARLDITLLKQVGQVPNLHDAKVVSKVKIDTKFLFIDVSVVVRVEILHARQVALAHLIELSFDFSLSIIVLLKRLLQELEPQVLYLAQTSVLPMRVDPDTGLFFGQNLIRLVITICVSIDLTVLHDLSTRDA